MRPSSGSLSGFSPVLIRVACLLFAVLCGLVDLVVFSGPFCGFGDGPPMGICAAAQATRTAVVAIPLAVLGVGLAWSLVTARLSPVGLAAPSSFVVGCALAAVLI